MEDPPEDAKMDPAINNDSNNQESTPGPSRQSNSTENNSEKKYHPYQKPKNKKRDAVIARKKERDDLIKFKKFMEDIEDSHGPQSPYLDVFDQMEYRRQRDARFRRELDELDEMDFSSEDSPQEPSRFVVGDSSSDSDDHVSYRSSSSSTKSSTTENDNGSKKDRSPSPDVLRKRIPKHKWSVLPEIRKRELGYFDYKINYKQFREKMYGSLHSLQRLQLMYKLEEHTGCVNGLDFNKAGNLLASCSDDYHVNLWNWASGKIMSTIKTTHSSNVFQCKFLPFDNYLRIVTCSRDGLVLLLDIDPSGHLNKTRRMGRHHRPAHKISLVPGVPPCFMSCGEDGRVYHYDCRERRPSKLLKVKTDEKLLRLYSIHCNPADPYEFMLGGHDMFLRIYDKRNVLKPLFKLNPSGENNRFEAYITSAVYNFNGTQFLASYNDDDIYLWDRKEVSNTDVVHRYQGHRNSATIKGVNFFGPNSEYVVSGSDCGNIYFWDRESEAIAMWMAGDENGVVNCVVPHPSVPVLASSGLDNDVKLWFSCSRKASSLDGLKYAVKSNFKNRKNHLNDTEAIGQIHPQMFWMLWTHLRRPDNA